MASNRDFLERDGLGEMLHSVKPGGIKLGALGHHSRRHIKEAAVDAVGRHYEGNLRLNHSSAQVHQAIIGRDEQELGRLEGRQRHHSIGGGLRTLEIGDNLREEQMKTAVRLCYVFKLRPDPLSNKLGGRHVWSLCLQGILNVSLFLFTGTSVSQMLWIVTC
jgi:hypothetical protein